jgi:hypothetical protein
MGEAKRKHLQEGEHTFSKDADAFDLIVDHVLEESDDINVVIGPTVHPPFGSCPRRPLVIHSMDDELQMAKWCEMLWPGERITKLRKGIEAERAEAAA